MSCNTLKEELPLPYRDKTPITKEYLLKNGFKELGTSLYLLSWGDILELEAEIENEEAGLWHIKITYYDFGTPNAIFMFTLGELRLFLAIEDLFDLIAELK